MFVKFYSQKCNTYIFEKSDINRSQLNQINYEQKLLRKEINHRIEAGQIQNQIFLFNRRY